MGGQSRNSFLELPPEKQFEWLKLVSCEISKIATDLFKTDRFSVKDLDELEEAINMKEARLLLEEISNDSNLTPLVC